MASVALECDVLDARPEPEIQWFLSNEQTPIAEETINDQILYLHNGRYLYIRILTAVQRMGEFHCEVVNAFLSHAPIRAPTTYVLTGDLTDHFVLTVYTPLHDLINVTLGETVKYVFAAATPGPTGANQPLGIHCPRKEKGPNINIQGLSLTITGLRGDNITGLQTIHCLVVGTLIFPLPTLDLTFQITRK